MRDTGGRSLPNRQLRKYRGIKKFKEESSLPNRQLRNKVKTKGKLVGRSLPNRQLRNLTPKNKE